MSANSTRKGRSNSSSSQDKCMEGVGRKERAGDACPAAQEGHADLEAHRQQAPQPWQPVISVVPALDLPPGPNPIVKTAETLITGAVHRASDVIHSQPWTTW